jgi:hypothetical protein
MAPPAGSAALVDPEVLAELVDPLVGQRPLVSPALEEAAVAAAAVGRRMSGRAGLPRPTASSPLLAVAAAAVVVAAESEVGAAVVVAPAGRVVLAW